MATNGVQLAIEEFQTLTDFNINEYLVRVEQFFTNNQPKIINWYKGNTDTPDGQSFKNLFIMLIESEKCLSTYVDIRSRFNLKFYHFELLEQLENVNTQIVKCLWYSKLLRSTRTLNSYKSKIEFDYVMKKYDTLESVQRKEIRFSGFDNAWWELALRNDLAEDQYDINGGQLLHLPMDYQAAPYLQSVVDNPIGDRMYGRDIKRKLTFTDDDLETLSYKDTALQALDIMMETQLETVPEFPKLGYNPSLVVGSTRGIVSLPVFQRQLLNVFKTDDSFVNYKITKLAFEEDAFILDFEINTVRGELLQKTIKI